MYCCHIFFSSRPLPIQAKIVEAMQGLNFIAAFAVEGEQNAVDHCGNDGKCNFYTIHCASLL